MYKKRRRPFTREEYKKLLFFKKHIGCCLHMTDDIQIKARITGIDWERKMIETDIGNFALHIFDEIAIEKL